MITFYLKVIRSVHGLGIRTHTGNKDDNVELGKLICVTSIVASNAASLEEE